MKFLRILFLFNTLIVLTFFVLLFTSESETNLSTEVTVEMPRPAAFQLFLKSLTSSATNPTKTPLNQIQFVYFQDQNRFAETYIVKSNGSQFTIDLVPVQSKYDDTLPAIRDIQHKIILQELADGSTAIQWKLSYKVKGWTARLLNRFSWKTQFERFLERKIQTLTNQLTLGVAGNFTHSPFKA